jgi:predicted nucleotidyltransferase
LVILIKVMLFGSRARKDHSMDSDYDFLVISKTTIDIQTITGHFLKQALREGVIVKDSKTTNNDWWNDLTETQKSGIERGLSDIKEGRTRSHEDVKNKYGL